MNHHPPQPIPQDRYQFPVEYIQTVVSNQYSDCISIIRISKENLQDYAEKQLNFTFVEE